MRVPIACTLTAGDAGERVDEWQRFLGRDIRAASGSGDSVRLLLADGDDALLRAVDLAEREHDCCRFFDFGIHLDQEGRWLTVGVPPEATGILTDLLSLLPAELTATS